MKKLLIVLLIIGGFGIVLMIGGFVLGASTSLFIDTDGFHIKNKGSEIIMNKDNLPAFTSMDISIASANVELIPSNSYGIDISSNRSNVDIVYSVENGVLKVDQHIRWFIGIFDFRSWFRETNVKIFYPAGSKFEYIYFYGTSGQMTADKIEASDIFLKLTSGRVILSDIVTDKMRAKVTSGSVNFNNLSTEKFDCDITSGTIYAKNLSSKFLNLKMTSGNFTAEGEMKGDNYIKLTSGNVNLGIYGNRADYSRDVDVTSGNVYIDGSRANGNEIIRSAPNSLTVKLTSGNVRVDFTE